MVTLNNCFCISIFKQLVYDIASSVSLVPNKGSSCSGSMFLHLVKIYSKFLFYFQKQFYLLCNFLYLTINLAIKDCKYVEYSRLGNFGTILLPFRSLKMACFPFCTLSFFSFSFLVVAFGWREINWFHLFHL